MVTLADHKLLLHGASAVGSDFGLLQMQSMRFYPFIWRILCFDQVSLLWQSLDMSPFALADPSKQKCNSLTKTSFVLLLMSVDSFEDLIMDLPKDNGHGTYVEGHRPNLMVQMKHRITLQLSNTLSVLWVNRII